MPELPEVETIRQDLTVLCNDQIVEQHVYRSAVFRGVLPDLVGEHIIAIARRGKLLLFKLSNNTWMLAHLKMTGKFTLVEEIPYTQEFPTIYTAFGLTFASGRKLYFDDIRKFGYLEVVDEKTKVERLRRYGIEPLTSNFTLDAFKAVFNNRRAPLKAVLLNQQLVAGLGNIYVDEVCFHAKVRPDRTVDTLTSEEITTIYNHIEPIIAKAVELRGTTFRNYSDAKGKRGGYETQLCVYGRGNQKCVICSHKIEKLQIAGRGTHICPNCQK